MKPVVLYARVSSKEQEQEGYSIPAQLKLLREYAARNRFQIVQEFVDVETAKATGRKQFGEMLRFLERNLASRTVIVEKTDRLYRNFKDYVTLEDLGVEIHLAKEGLVVGKDAKSPAKLMHGIQVVLARNYIENLREEVRKGMREKAEQGIYPSRPPLGYRNNKLTHTIEVDGEAAPIARRLFELYATGDCSLAALRQRIREETGRVFAKGYLHRLLKNPFYNGFFVWENKTYAGTQERVVDQETYEKAQRALEGRNHPKHQKRDFAFAGLLSCAYDRCAVTAEIKKERYVYYHCTGYRGKCELPYFREEKLAERLGTVLKGIYIPDDVLEDLQTGLVHDQKRAAGEAEEQRQRLELRLASVRRRIDQAYLDKLDGKISEEFWQRKTAEWRMEEQQVLLATQAFEEPQSDRLFSAARILELANKAHFLYLRQKPEEQGKLLRMVLSNCVLDRVSLYPNYRKPFDIIFQRVQTKEWRALRDSNSRPSGS